MNRDTKFFINISLAIAGFIQVFGEVRIMDPKLFYIIAVTNNLIIQ